MAGNRTPTQSWCAQHPPMPEQNQPKSRVTWHYILAPDARRPQSYQYLAPSAQAPTVEDQFDFLGFTHYCGKTRRNKFMVKRKTQAKRLVRKLKAIREEMQRRMHAPVREQHRWLCQVLNGHYQYFGVIFNYRSMRVFKDCVVRQWRKALGKRSQKGRMNWATYRQLLTAFPLPQPAIHQAWHNDR